MENVTFESMGLPEYILQAVKEQGFAHPTPIQALAVPPLMDWKDIIAKAPTGSGKTFAFGIPVLVHTDTESSDIQTMILGPTRELVLQICDELSLLAKFRPGIRITSLYGGQPIERQIAALKKKPQIIVATPGRLLDLLHRRCLRLDRVQTAVVDEADRMLDMGFLPDVDKILKQVPNRRNLAMLSATISREVMDVSWVYQRDPVELTVPEVAENKPDITQYWLSCVSVPKTEAVLRILALADFDRVIIFCNTKHMTRTLTEILQRRHVSADCIHGDNTQVLREKVLRKFRDGQLKVLVATDVAARGLDIEAVDCVINYDLPAENEYYVHRIGRTARAGASGMSFLFVEYQEEPRLRELARRTHNDIIKVYFDENKNLVQDVPAEG
jgi:ATP-dependent RNA helicase DeaD